MSLSRTVVTLTWSRAPRPPPLPPASMVYGPGWPPSCGMEWGVPLPPVGWLWGFCGFGSSLSLKLLSFGFWVNRYKASSRQGLREDWGVGSLRLTVYVWFRLIEPAFRRGLGLGKFRLRLIKAGAGATALRYRIYGLRRVLRTMLAWSVTPGRFSSCSSNGPHPSPHTPAPPPPPPRTRPYHWGGGVGTPDA